MKKVMVVAGGEWQVPLVKMAKDAGYEVLCTNMYVDSPAFKYSDYSEIADVLDIEKNVKIAEKYRPDVIITDQSDIAVRTVSHVAKHIGVKGIDTETAELFTNKFRMRQFEKKYGFKHPEFSLCRSYDEAVAFLKENKIEKAVIKPTSAQSSRGVFVVSSESNFEKEFMEAGEYRTESGVLIEEYIEGVEFTVDGLMIADQYYTLSISRKKHYVHNECIASELLFSWDDDEYDYRELETINRSHIEKTGLSIGVTHSEYKYCNGTFYLIEMAARGGGTLISSDINPYMSGINGIGVLLEYLSNGTVPVLKPQRGEKMAVLHFFTVDAGKVEAIEGVEKVKEIKGVHLLDLDFKVGDTIVTPDNDRARCGFYIAFADTRCELETIMKQVDNTIRIKVV